MSGGSLSDQLRPLAQRLGPGPKLRPIHLVTGLLRGDDPHGAARVARGEVLKWITNKVGRALPVAAWEGRSFELSDTTSPAEAVHFADGDVDHWVATVDDPDKSVAQRIWRTELTVATVGGRAAFGARLTLLTRDASLEGVIPGLPGPVLQIADLPGFEVDGRAAAKEPWVLRDSGDLRVFLRLLANPSRRRLIYVLSLDEEATDPATAIVDVRELAQRTVGIAHVVVLPGLLSFELSDVVGKFLSVFHRAVRIYRPGFKVDGDDPYRHPLFLPERVTAWGQRGATDFLAQLVWWAADDSVSRLEDGRLLPDFATIQRRALENEVDRARELGQPDETRLRLADEARAMAERAAKDWEEMAYDEETRRVAAEERARAAEADRERLLELVKRLSAEKGDLLTRLQATGAAVEEKVERPGDYDEIAEWVERELAGRLTLHPRARRGLKEAIYEDFELVVDALLLLAGGYRDMKLGQGRPAFDRRRNELKLECLPCFASEAAARAEGKAYFPEWQGRARYLDMHLKRGGGGGQDQRRILRVYFFWDDDPKQVVVGWLPSHLPTAISN